MSEIDGSYDTTVKTPMGEQNGVLTVKTDGDSFTGTMAGDMGSADISGTVAGNTIEWKMDVSKPMPISLTSTATIEGDTLTGSVDTGAFGSFPMTGTRKA